MGMYGILFLGKKEHGQLSLDDWTAEPGCHREEWNGSCLFLWVSLYCLLEGRAAFCLGGRLIFLGMVI